MNGWNGYSSGAGAGHGPSEERGRPAWSSEEAGTAPPWASAETQTSLAPPWATAGTRASHVPSWTPGPAPAPHRVRRVLAALAVAVLVGVSVGTGVWWLLRDTALGSGTRTGGKPVPSLTAAPSSPSPSASTASGYRRVQDPVGYSVDVPRSWTRTEKRGGPAPVVVYGAPADGRRLQVFRIAEDTPAQSLDLAENAPGYGFAHRPGYQVLDRTSGTTWAEIVYHYDDPDLGARQVVDHRFQAADGTLYAIRAAGPASLPPHLVRDPLTRALASFCPADTECV
ncbi:hypothetical protein [Streptomyces sp. NPDC006335]|uniref:hypothetical protein n=1 Tax=Streptomyces sp. NPDC006335 TaxID=3156895 RepID=UPI0033B20826